MVPIDNQVSLGRDREGEHYLLDEERRRRK